MNLRRDALAGAARIIAEVEAAARRHDLVATVGRIVCLPNGVNVVPARVTASLDIRASDDGHRDRVLGGILDDAGRLCRERGLGLTIADTHSAGAVQCAPDMQRAVAAGIEAAGLPVHHMASGAGHDAMALATLCPVGMMFVRCAGGISHHPAESVTVEDVATAGSALQHAVLALADARGSGHRPAGSKEELP
jgi:hydantoinase/carbamoylase family amidase